MRGSLQQAHVMSYLRPSLLLLLLFSCCYIQLDTINIQHLTTKEDENKLIAIGRRLHPAKSRPSPAETDFGHPARPTTRARFTRRYGVQWGLFPRLNVPRRPPKSRQPVTARIEEGGGRLELIRVLTRVIALLLTFWGVWAAAALETVRGVGCRAGLLMIQGTTQPPLFSGTPSTWNEAILVEADDPSPAAQA